MMTKEKQYAPLSGGFMLTAMLGFLISVIYVWKMSPSWGFAFEIVFTVMFLASMTSMTHADPDTFIELETKEKTKTKKKKTPKKTKEKASTKKAIKKK